MNEDIKDIDKPFHVVSVLDNKEGFYSGHFDKESATSRCNQSNKQAIDLNIKSRYIVKENVKVV